MPDNDLIILKNSNPLNKYPVDAEQLNHNFDILHKNQGGVAIKHLIESTGQIYTPIIDEQLAMAVSQYVFSCTLFDEKGTTDAFVLQPRDGFVRPYRYTYGMTVSFIPTRTNTGPMTLQIGTLEAYPVLIGTNPVSAGYLTLNTLTTFRFFGNYWSQITESSTGSSGSSSTSSGETDSFVANALRTAIISAGIAYDPTDVTQLTKAIANYVVNSLYRSTLENSNYNLTSFTYSAIPTKYDKNMLVWFIADKNNTANPSLSFKNLQQTIIVDFFGNVLPANTITAGELVACIFDGYNFKLVSQYKSALSLRNGVRVTDISDDTSLSNAASTALVTEHAVKSYVDTKVKGTKENLIISGYEVNQQPSSLRIVSEHRAQLLAGTGLESEKTVEDNTPTETANLIASSNQTKAINAVSKVTGKYWESVKVGFAVDDIQRTVSGTDGSKYISIVYDSNGNPVYLHTIPEQSYIGFSGLTKHYDVLKIKHTDENHTPQSIRLYVNTSPTLDSALWIPLCDRAGQEGNYYADYTYGTLSALSTDANGYYVIDIPTYISQNNTVSVFSPEGAYAIKIVATEFNNQFATTETINTPGYNPNNDTTSTTVKYSWQIADMVLGNYLIGVDPFVISYPDGSLENITTPITYTQFVNDSTSSNAVLLADIDAGRYIVYKIYGVDALYSISKSLVFRQSMQPPATEENDGGIWINISSVPYQTYICNEVVNEETGAISYSWNKTSVMLIGGLDIAGNKFVQALNYRYGDSFVADYEITPTKEITIEHYFGSDVTVHCYLVCKQANNSYLSSEQILLTPYINKEYSLSGDLTSGYTLQESMSYFNVTNTNITTTIKARNLQIINKTTDKTVIVPENSWLLRVYINKD